MSSPWMFSFLQLRALVQQSDASGVQKKTDSPYNPQGASNAQAQTTTTDNIAVSFCFTL